MREFFFHQSAAFKFWHFWYKCETVEVTVVIAVNWLRLKSETMMHDVCVHHSCWWLQWWRWSFVVWSIRQVSSAVTGCCICSTARFLSTRTPCCTTTRYLQTSIINQSINFYLLKLGRITRATEQDEQDSKSMTMISLIAVLETCGYELTCITLHRWRKVYRYYKTFESVQRRKIYTGW